MARELEVKARVIGEISVGESNLVRSDAESVSRVVERKEAASSLSVRVYTPRESGKFSSDTSSSAEEKSSGAFYRSNQLAA